MTKANASLNLKDIINYVKGENGTSKVELLTSATVTALMIANPTVGATASAAYTLQGSSVSAQVKRLFGVLDNKRKENQAIEVYERCTFTEVLLSRLAVKEVILKNLNSRDRLFAQWRLIRTIEEEQQKEISRLDEERESEFLYAYVRRKSFSKENYWNELLDSIIFRVIDVYPDEILNFKEQMLNEVESTYKAFENQVSYESQLFKNYIHRAMSEKSIEKIIEKLNEQVEFMHSYGNMYQTIDEVDQWLKASTDPSISLNFFNYEEKAFEEQFIQQLSNDVIYLKGKTREEVAFYILFIIKNQVKNREQDTYIINKKENWDAIKGKCEGKILIPNFHASVVETIPNNTNIIIYSEEDYIGNKQPIELNKRILSNMSNMLQDEVEDLALANRIVDKSNGLYTTFKRMVFKGKMGHPKWEENTDVSFIPALLTGSWTESNSLMDTNLLSEIAQSSYKEYKQSISNMVGGEDPFLLVHKNYQDKIYKLANVEEAWEIIFPSITPKAIAVFKEAVVEALTNVAPVYHLQVEEHYKGSILNKGSEYSERIKKGMIRSLIMLANMDGRDNYMDIHSTQNWVDALLIEVLDQIDSQAKWYAISEFLPMIAEASPKAVLNALEREASDSESPIWQLFEKNSNGFWGRNYYTHILWALEKLMCLEETALRAIKIVALLAEREVEYSISNSPMSTLHHALCAWMHDINISVTEKIEITDYLVKRSKIGWGLLELILPDRTPRQVMMKINEPQYRYFKMNYKLTQRKEIKDTYKAYTEIAIREAKDDLSKWEIIFNKFCFFELGLTDGVVAGVTKAIGRCDSDKSKYMFKEKVRELLHRHRFYCESEWAVKEEYLSRIEEEVFSAIHFENNLFDFLHLFTADRLISIHPTPYKEKRHDYSKERQDLGQMRSEALEAIFADPNITVIDLLTMLNAEHRNGRRAIGQIIASELDRYILNSVFVDELLEENEGEVLLAYIQTIYDREGLQIISEVLKKIEDSLELKVELLKIAEVSEELLTLIASCDQMVAKLYWETFSPYTEVEDETVRLITWDKLLENKNYSAAIVLLDNYYFEDFPKHVDLLTNILENPGDYNVNYDRYHVQRAFQRIYEMNGIAPEQETQIRQLEWAYFHLLKDEIKPKYLLQELKTNPVFMAEMIHFAFKSSDELEEPRELTENEKALAQQAYSILFELKFCPCVDEENELSLEELKRWTSKYLEKIDENKQTTIGIQQLGESFAHSPTGSDGHFPHEAVREVFENHYSEHLHRGFIIGVNNSRGIYTITNGKEEDQLATEYERHARAMRVEYPHMASTLKAISDDYKRQSEVDRERATHDL
ncbi:hypothetical protein [Indiicoccus explosivorum]|uniref:hypothetical protein n=1 Tax=Indiicoccus explosivorum TaxID=1917864 RepID=UPI000B44F10C|nr:hypothetical protein [Indiicoccus explosivorum]